MAGSVGAGGGGCELGQFGNDLLFRLRWKPLRAWLRPGNVRELIDSIKMAMIAARHEATLFAEHLPQAIRMHRAKSSLIKKGVTERLREDDKRRICEALPHLRGYRDALERQYLQKLMALSAGSSKQVCAISGLSRSRLYELLKYHQTEPSK
jgi:two-component system NtrC family response regulator